MKVREFRGKRILTKAHLDYENILADYRNKSELNTVIKELEQELENKKEIIKKNESYTKETLNEKDNEISSLRKQIQKSILDKTDLEILRNSNSAIEKSLHATTTKLNEETKKLSELQGEYNRLKKNYEFTSNYPISYTEFTFSEAYKHFPELIQSIKKNDYKSRLEPELIQKFKDLKLIQLINDRIVLTPKGEDFWTMYDLKE